MYQKLIAGIFAIAAMAAVAVADAGFDGDMPGAAAQILADFQIETNEPGFSYSEAVEAAEALHDAGARGILRFPGGTLTV